MDTFLAGGSDKAGFFQFITGRVKDVERVALAEGLEYADLKEPWLASP